MTSTGRRSAFGFPQLLYRSANAVGYFITEYPGIDNPIERQGVEGKRALMEADKGKSCQALLSGLISYWFGVVVGWTA